MEKTCAVKNVAFFSVNWSFISEANFSNFIDFDRKVFAGLKKFKMFIEQVPADVVIMDACKLQEEGLPLWVRVLVNGKRGIGL